MFSLSNSLFVSFTFVRLAQDFSGRDLSYHVTYDDTMEEWIRIPSAGVKFDR
jgi:hypothetical protein